MLQSVWSYRGFVRGLILQEFRDRSARTLWGHAWLVIEPAVQIGIYVVIFSTVLQAKLPGSGDRLSYSIYLCSGLLAWNFFAGLLLQGRTLFVEHADLLRTIRFPRSTLPIALLDATSSTPPSRSPFFWCWWRCWAAGPAPSSSEPFPFC